MTTDTVPPLSVRKAVICLWISVGLGLLMTMAQVTSLVPKVGASTSVTAVIGLTTAGLLALIAVKTNAGQGWARWLFVVLYVIGTLTSIALAVVAPAMFIALPTILQANIIVQFVLQTLALVFMFTSTSRHWSKSKRVGAAP
jgi:hypothetical protein